MRPWCLEHHQSETTGATAGNGGTNERGSARASWLSSLLAGVYPAQSTTPITDMARIDGDPSGIVFAWNQKKRARKNPKLARISQVPPWRPPGSPTT
jgi:hypothetical protein